MSTITWYNGITDGVQIVTPEPAADGGKALNDNFKRLVTTLSASNPNPATDDNAHGFGIGSLWINTTTMTEWVCRNATPGSVVWAQLGYLPANGAATITADSATTVPLTLSLASAATANALEVKNSSGSVIAYIEKSGRLVSKDSGTMYISGWQIYGQNGLQFASATIFTVNSSNFSLNTGSYSGTGNSIHCATSYSSTATAGTFVGLKLTGTYNQVSSTTANTDFLITRTATSMGSGSQYFIDAQVGGSSKFSVSSSGVVFGSGVTLNPLASAPSSPVAGQIYFSSADSHFYGYNGSQWKQLDN